MRLQLRYLVITVLLTLGTVPAWSQTTGASNDSQEVDEAEKDFRDSKKVDEVEASEDALPPLPESTTVEEAGPLDRLPPESVRHLNAEMRKVIMENGQWEPADMAADYPYVPSEAAKTDDSVRADEEAAWEQMVADYHAREQRAQARSENQAGSTGNAQQGNPSAPGSAATDGGAGTTGSAAGAGGGGSGSGSGAGSGSGQQGAGVPAASGTPPPGTTASPAPGEAFSALEYLEQLGQAGAASTNSQAQGQPAPEATAKPLPAGDATDATQPGTTATSETDLPAGSVPIMDLGRLLEESSEALSAEPDVDAEQDD